ARKRWHDKLLYHTQVIWYAAKENESLLDKEQSINIFMRINSGKIPLTNAELIKALFIHHVADPNNAAVLQLQQAEMAQQWDMIEHGLQDDEFWAFLQTSNRDIESGNRIELLFDLISGKTKAASNQQSASYDPLYAFNYFDVALKNAADKRVGVLELWHRIKQGYFRLLEWYRNDELYHLTGFLITRKICSIQDLWKLADQRSKSEFIESLKSIVGKTLTSYFKGDDGKSLDFSRLQYGVSKDRQKIISVFTLLNICVHRLGKTRLSFNTYRRVNWDIEHIHAQNAKPVKDDKQIAIWYSDQKGILKSTDIPRKSSEELEVLLDNWYRLAESKNDDAGNTLDEYLKRLAETVGDFREEEKDSLDNLCLLSDKVNRGIGNEIFSVKRQMIIDYEKQGDGEGSHFIPLATKQVFSKYFSSNVSQMHKWSRDDRLAYRKALIDCFSYYTSMEGMK
ncbi:DUF1524 domain-containing protein, partial [Oleiphilus sp. HI0061]|uniref:DUF1524 domain-containing protein n=1 Tax=Oleiphilus sp. HI0061 TaxID=1822239 RepID=UPI000AB45FDB